MSSSEIQELSNHSPGIDGKFPQSCFLSMTPLNTLRARDPQIQIMEETSNYNEKFERVSSLKSPGNRKKNFSSPKRSLKVDDLVKKRNPEFSKLLVKQAIKITQKVRVSAYKFLNSYRRRKSYSIPENLTHYHYELIGDAAAQPEDDERMKMNRFLDNMRKSFFRKIANYFLTNLKLQMIDELVFNKIPKVNPNSSFKLLWDILLLIISIICLIFYSIEKCFKTDINLASLSLSLMFMFYVDVGVKLNTKHFLDGTQIVERSKILRHYLKNYFLTDIVPCLGLSLFCFANDDSMLDVNIFLCLRFIRAPELGQRLMEIAFRSERAESFYNLIILLLKIFTWGHIIACLWHYTGYMTGLEDPQQDNWLKHRGILDTDWKNRYLFSIYWSVTTMLTVGYGDITPTNKNEMYFNIMAMILGCGVFGYSMNKIGEILKYGGKKERLMKSQMKKVDSLMQDKGLPLETQTKVKKYLEFVLKQEQREDTEHEELIMSKLSSKLRDEVFFYTNVKYLKKVPAFQSFSNETLIKLATFMKKIRISPEEYLYRDGDYEDICAYFVIDGSVELVSEQENVKGKSSVTWKTIKKEGCLGIQEIFTGCARRTSAVAIEFGSLFQLNRADVLKVLRKNPHEYEIFCKLRDLDIIYNQQSQYHINCDSCGYSDHITQECRFLCYEPNKLNVIGRYNLIKRRKEKNVRRLMKKKNNALISKQHNITDLNEFLAVYHDDEDLCELIMNVKMGEPEAEIPIHENSSPKHLEESDSNELRIFIPSSHGSSPDMFPNNIQEEFKRPNRTRNMTIHFLKSMNKKSIIHANNEIPSKIMTEDSKSDKGKAVTEVIKHLETERTGTNPLEKNKQKQYSEESLIIDKLKSMKHYFPWNNVENVLNKNFNLRKSKKFLGNHLKIH